MPYINIRLGVVLNNNQRQALYQKTTQLMNTLMGKRAEVTVVHIQESEPYYWSVNAATLDSHDPVGAYVDIKITQGTNSSEEKAKMLSETVNMLKNIIGAAQEACYVVIDEIAADSWGYNGMSQAARAAMK